MFDARTILGSPLKSFLPAGLTGETKAPELERMAVISSNSTGPGSFAQVRAMLESASVGRRKAATVAAGLLALAVGYHVVFGANGLTMYEHKRQEAQELKQRMQTLQQENERLQGHVERLESDPDAIEHQAREQMHYTKPGEVIYTLPTK